MKINHSEKLRQVYATRAAENEAEAVEQITRPRQGHFKKLANWDHQQEKHFAGQAADALSHLMKIEADVVNKDKGTGKTLGDLHKDLNTARKQEEVVHAKGESRIAGLEIKLSNTNARLLRGGDSSHVSEVDPQNKSAAQSTFDIMPENVILEQDQTGNGKTLGEEVVSVDSKTPTGRR
jgi:hypothetical protein